MIEPKAESSKLSGYVKFLRIAKHGWVTYLLVFAFFVSIRGIAEIQAGDLPAGWDPLNYYAPWTVAYMNEGVINEHFVAAPPLIFILMISMTFLTRDVWLAIKILSPILYGVLGVCFLYFTSSYLSWSKKKGIVCALLLMSQIAALRLSWDLFKNQLAMSLLFLQLPLLSSASKKGEAKTKLMIILLSLLIVLTHPFVTVFYLVVLLSIILNRKHSTSFKKYLLLANVPALILFIGIFGIYSQWTKVSLVSYPGIGTTAFFKTIHYVDTPTFSVFKNYIVLYGSYSNLSVQVMSLFILLYAPILPLVFLGFWNDRFLTPILILGLLSAFLPIVSPSFALLDFERWMFMLVYLFAVFSANALFKLMQPSQSHGKPSSGFKQLRFLSVSREKLAASLYLLFIIIFALNYTVGNVRLIYTPIEHYIPTALSDKPISNEAMRDIVANSEWLNQFYQNKSAVSVLDEFDDLDSVFWWQEGNFSIKDSVLTLNTEADSGISYLYHDFDANYWGTIKLKFKFNAFTLNSYMLDLISVHKSSSYGGGVIYCLNTSNNAVLNYWDSETQTAYSLMPLDHEWHTIGITCNATGRKISIDELDRIFVNTGQLFGELTVGVKINSTGYGGSFSIDYVSVNADFSACLISSYREIGPLWINVRKEIEIVGFVKDLDRALDFAKNKPYSTILLLLPSISYERFTLVHSMQTYSVYTWGK
jgi:hypothetical protein